jgi:hypothetical protein
MSKLNFEYDVRIPAAMITQMMEGEITASMLLTMNMLYLWSNWNTGKVRRVCASSLCYASSEAFSANTFSEALRRLEWMGWITRHMKPGSHKWYPVTIHNYKMTETKDGVTRVHIVNPRDIEVYETFPQGRRDDAVNETVDRSGDEGVDETVDRHYSLPESEHQSSNETEPKLKEREVSKEVSEAEGTSCPLLPNSEEARQTFYWSKRNQREFTIEEASVAFNYLMELFPRSDGSETDTALMADIALDFQARYPNPLPKDDYDHYASSVAESHACKTMAEYLTWNRKHKKSAMQHATVAEFHRAWFSDNPRCARVQWEDHDLAECKLCKLKPKPIEIVGDPLAKNAYRDTQELLHDLKRGVKPKAAPGGFDVEEA